LLASASAWAQAAPDAQQPKPRIPAAPSAWADTCIADVDPAVVAKLVADLNEVLRTAPASDTQAQLEVLLGRPIALSGARPVDVDAALTTVLASELTPLQRAAVEALLKRVREASPACGGPAAGAGGLGRAALAPPPAGSGGGGTDYPAPVTP